MILTKENPCAIVIPKNPTMREEFAAEELKKYIKMLCGAALPVTREVCEPAIYIGSPKKNAGTAKFLTQEEFEKVCPGPEGIYLQSFGDSLVIAGSDDNFERGTIYAVYELLERFFGCSLAAFTDPAVPGGEYIPQCTALDISGISYVKPACDLIYRAASVQYADGKGNADKGLNIPFLDWLTKNRHNGIKTWMTCYEKLKELGLLVEAERRGLPFICGHHEASGTFLPAHGNKYFPEHYYETHPEYFRLQEDGTRYEDTTFWGQWIFCSRNEEMLQELIKNVIEWLRQNPMVNAIYFPPNDGMAPQCVCPECAKYKKVDNYLYVLNRVSQAVRKVYPNTRIQYGAYTDLLYCPEEAEIDPGIYVGMATWSDKGLRTTGKPDGSCLNGTYFEKNLLDWKHAGAFVCYSDYQMGVYEARNRLIPMADEIQAIAKNCVDKGISGLGTQIECFNMWNNLFNFYSFGRTQYDTSLDMEQNLKNFCKIFGEGADEVAEIIRHCEDIVDGQESIYYAAMYLQKHVDKERVYRLYDEALAKTTDRGARNNIRLMRMAFRYSDIEVADPLSPMPGVSKYFGVHEYEDPTGELKVMGEFDSFWQNYVGYGIDIPARSLSNAVFEKNIWYLFD